MNTPRRRFERVSTQPTGQVTTSSLLVRVNAVGPFVVNPLRTLYSNHYVDIAVVRPNFRVFVHY